MIKIFFKKAWLQSHHKSIFTRILNTAETIHQWKNHLCVAALHLNNSLVSVGHSVCGSLHMQPTLPFSGTRLRELKVRFNSFPDCLILFSCYVCLSLMTRVREVWLQQAFDQNPERFQSPVASSCGSLLITQTGSDTPESGVNPGDSYEQSQLTNTVLLATLCI